MGIRTVLTWPNPRLREVADPVETFDATIRALVADMFATMASEGGVGLAATQIGVPLRIVVMDCGMESPEPLTLINAQIRERDGSILWNEGCLSIPGIKAEIERSEHIVVDYQDPRGTEHTLEASGLLSVCIQHELDHLDGQLYFDRLGAFERQATLNAYEEAQALRLHAES